MQRKKKIYMEARKENKISKFQEKSKENRNEIQFRTTAKAINNRNLPTTFGPNTNRIKIRHRLRNLRQYKRIII